MSTNDDLYNGTNGTGLSSGSANITEEVWDDTQKSLSRRKFISTAALAVGTVALFTTADTFTGGTVKAGEFNDKIDGLGNDIKSIKNSYIPVAEKASANGVATLGKDGRVPLTQLPTGIAIAGVTVVQSKSELDALDKTEGSIVVVLDDNQTYSYVKTSWESVNIGGEGAATVGNGAPTTAPGATDPKVYVNSQDGGIYAWDSTNNTWVSATYTPAYKSPVTPVGNLTSTNTQDALEELQSDVDTLTANSGSTSGTGIPTAAPAANAPVYYVDKESGDMYTYNTTTGAWEKVNDAKNTSYTNATSGLTATNVQGAIDEIDATLDEVLSNQGSTTGTGAPTNTPDIAGGEPAYYVDAVTGNMYTYNTTTGAWETLSDSQNISNTPTGNLSATTVQGALNELQGDVDTLNTTVANNLTTLQTADTNLQNQITSNDGDITDILSTLGTVDGDTNLGTFTGSTIADGSNVKTALQSLETAHEVTASDVSDVRTALGLADNQTNLGAFTGSTIADNSTLVQALQSLETKAEAGGANLAATSGTGTPTVAPNYAAGEPGYYVDKATGDFYAYNTTSSAWEKISNTTTVTNNNDGTYTITTAEGVNQTIDTRANVLPYTNTTSGLTATNVQGAIDEVDSNVDDIRTALGLADNQTNYGTTFTGTTIPDNSTLVQALQALETKSETAGSGLTAMTGTGAPTVAPNYANGETGIYTDSSNGDVYTYNTTTNAWENASAAVNTSYANTTSGLTATTVQGAIDELDAALDAIDAIAYTEGSVLFAGTDGKPTQDNANLFWDDTNNRLGVGTLTPRSKLDVAGLVSFETLDMKGNDGGYFSMLKLAVAAPNQHLHYMADYTKQAGATDVSALFGFNSEISRYEWFTKWNGVNTSLFTIMGGTKNAGFGVATPATKLSISAKDNDNYFGLEGWSGTTTNATQTEIFVQGVANQRLVVDANSVVTFNITVAAKDQSAGNVNAYNLQGTVKRDGANNTVVAGSITKNIVTQENATLDVTVEADDTNEALIIKVTGDAANTIQWVAQGNVTIAKF